MRERLLMLASLSAEKYALDVRELFGDDYDKIRERKFETKSLQTAPEQS